MSIAFGALLFYIIVGGGIPFCFGLASMVMEFVGGVNMKGILAQALYEISSPVLLAIPLFVYGGSIIGESGFAESLLDLVNIWIGRIKGGLGVVCVITCALMGAISGSSFTGIATVGPIMIPRMANEGYPRSYSTALICVSTILGTLIPPSIPLIMYGWISETSIVACFAATILPGIVAAMAFSLINLIYVKKFNLVTPAPKIKHEKINQIRKAGTSAIPALLLPVIILYGIYGGVFSPSEAAAVAVAYAIPVGFLIYKGLELKEFIAFTASSTTIVAAIMLSIFSCTIFSQTAIMLRIPQRVTEVIIGLSDNKYVILAIVNLIFIVAGMFISDIVAILLIVPLLMPLLETYSISAVHFGAIVGVSLAIGVVTPPYANALYLGIRIGKTTFSETIKPLMAILLPGFLPVMLLTTYVPEFSLFIPRLLGLLN